MKIMEKIVTSGKSEDAEYFEHYGYILKKLGKCNDAVKNWERAISLDETKTNLNKEIRKLHKIIFILNYSVSYSDGMFSIQKIR